MGLFDVVLLTDSRYVDPVSPGKYVQNILDEDQIVRESLEGKGLKVCRKDWADPEFDWGSTRSVLFRTNWDYFDRFEEFSKWLISTSLKAKFINTADLVNWNVNKQYLAYLAGKDIPIVPTRYITRGTRLSLEQLHALTGWKETVIKPTVGGAARHTYSITHENLHAVSNKLEKLMKEEDFMLQPFQYSILEKGEISLMIFGDQFSHSVLKKAKEGDFRVQDDHGGTVHNYKASEEEITFALKAVEACPEKPAYARVDMVRDNDGELAVSELELIEPELWFRYKPSAAMLLADEVIERLN